MATEPAPQPYDASANAQFNILRRPDLDNLPVLKNLEVVRLGDIAVATAGFGDYESSADFITRYRNTGIELKNTDLEMIEQSGFTGGFRWPQDRDGRDDGHQETHAQIGAALAKRVMKERGWDGIDVLTIGSISSRADIAQRTAEILRQDGITVQEPLFVGLACAGVSALMGDLNRMAHLKNARVAMVGLESLSGKQFRPQDVQTSWTFGNAVGAMAFRAGKDIIHHGGKTWVEQDNGMITIPDPPIYTLPDNNLPPEKWPEWYTFVNEESRKAFAFYPGGVMMKMASVPGQDYTTLTPQKTFKHFGRTVPPHLVEFFQENPQFKTSNLGTPIIHNPSEPVLIGLIGFYEKARVRLEKEGIIIPQLDLRWMMDKTGVNNVSAATIVFVIKQMIKENLIKQGVLTPIIGLAIGSTEHIDIAEFVQP